MSLEELHAVIVSAMSQYWGLRPWIEQNVRHGVFTRMSQLVDMAMREIHCQMLIEENWIKERDVLDAHQDPVVGVWFGL